MHDIFDSCKFVREFYERGIYDFSDNLVMWILMRWGGVLPDDRRRLLPTEGSPRRLP